MSLIAISSTSRCLNVSISVKSTLLVFCRLCVFVLRRCHKNILESRAEPRERCRWWKARNKPHQKDPNKRRVPAAKKTAARMTKQALNKQPTRLVIASATVTNRRKARLCRTLARCLTTFRSGHLPLCDRAKAWVIWRRACSLRRSTPWSPMDKAAWETGLVFPLTRASHMTVWGSFAHFRTILPRTSGFGRRWSIWKDFAVNCVVFTPPHPAFWIVFGPWMRCFPSHCYWYRAALAWCFKYRKCDTCCCVSNQCGFKLNTLRGRPSA